MQDLITFDKGDTNLANVSYESPPPSNHMPTHEPTSPILTPSCDPNHSPLVHQPSSPSSPCSPNLPPKDPLEITVQQLVQENLFELTPIEPFEENYIKPRWYNENHYCAYHRAKGHTTLNCAKLKRLIKNLIYCGKINPNPSNPIIPPSNPNPNMSNPIIPPSKQNPNHDHKPTTPSTLIIHPLYYSSTHTLAKDVIQWLLARDRTPPCQTPIHEPLSSTSPSPSNNKLKSSPQSTPSPIVHRILQNMNYQGKGLGLYEQGILEPIHVKIPPRSYCLG